MILFCPVLRHFINLIIGSCANDNYQYFCSDKLIHDTDIGITEFDFQETRQIITLLISQRLSIAFSVTDRGFWRTFPLALTTRNR